MLKINNKDTRTTPYFTPYAIFSIVNFEQVNAGLVALFLFKQLLTRLARLISQYNETILVFYQLQLIKFDCV